MEVLGRLDAKLAKFSFRPRPLSRIGSHSFAATTAAPPFSPSGFLSLNVCRTYQETSARFGARFSAPGVITHCRVASAQCLPLENPNEHRR